MLDYHDVKKLERTLYSLDRIRTALERMGVTSDIRDEIARGIALGVELKSQVIEKGDDTAEVYDLAAAVQEYILVRNS